MYHYEVLIRFHPDRPDSIEERRVWARFADKYNTCNIGHDRKNPKNELYQTTTLFFKSESDLTGEMLEHELAGIEVIEAYKCRLEAAA